MSAPVTIENCWMAVSVEANGDEGVCAIMVGNTWMPLIAADRARLSFVEEQAQMLADQLPTKTFKIIRLTDRNVIRTVKARTTQ